MLFVSVSVPAPPFVTPLVPVRTLPIEVAALAKIRSSAAPAEKKPAPPLMPAFPVCASSPTTVSVCIGRRFTVPALLSVSAFSAKDAGSVTAPPSTIFDAAP